MRYVVLDFESASQHDLKNHGSSEYAYHYSTSLLSIGYKIIDDQWVYPTKIIYGSDVYEVNPELYELASDPFTMFVCHNAAFEIGMWAALMVPAGYPAMPPERWHDTMAVAARKGMPLSLEYLCQALGTQVKKDLEGHAVMMRMCKPNKDGSWNHSEENFQKLNAYNRADVDTQYHSHLLLGGLGSDERQNWILDQYMNLRGFAVDRNFIYRCQDILEQVKKPALGLFRRITHGLAPTQRDKFLDWLNKNGVPVDDTRKETMEAIINGDEDLEFTPSAEVMEAIKIRRALSSASVKKLQSMLNWSEFDGRVRFTMQYHGARTGRIAGRGVQIQNFPRGSLHERAHSLGNQYENADELEKSLITAIKSGDAENVKLVWGDDVYEAIISVLRACIVPTDGNYFVVSDYSGVEARIIMALARQFDVLNRMASGNDEYAQLASIIFGRSINKKDDPEERQTGKNGLLGSQYGIGASGFQNRFMPKAPIALVERIIESYRKKYAPKVPKLWYGLQEASNQAAWDRAGRSYSYDGIAFQKEGDYLTLLLPSNRKIYYHRPEPFKGDYQDTWTFSEYKGSGQKRTQAWHGMLTNHLVQGCSRDLLYNAIRNCLRTKVLMPVFTVHDEIVCEASSLNDRKNMKELMDLCMLDLPAWARDRGFKIDCETQIRERYGK